MKINSFEDLQKLENKIGSQLRTLRLGDVLFSLRYFNHLEPFMIAGITLFACRYCTPSKINQNIKQSDIKQIVEKIVDYLLADPITFDKTLKEEFIHSNPVYLLLRIVSHQFPFYDNPFGRYAQPKILFHELPKQIQGKPDVPDFNLEEKFLDLNGVSLINFLTVGFVASAASRSNFTFSQAYFNKARSQGINLPEDKELQLVINQLATDSSQIKNLYQKYQNSDRRFAMYDFNPLFLYPIIRPCQGKHFQRITPNQDFFHAPLPQLIDYRISTGIYYQLFNEYKEDFSKYFGYLFEAYVGEVIKNSLTSETLLSEIEARQFYPTNKGKVPDWIVVDGNTLILIECKATRFSRAAQAIASEDAINKSLAQVKKGLKQLNSFINACKSKLPELERFQHCNAFKPVLITFEPLELINSEFFREHINQLLQEEEIQDLAWQILSVGNLEILQPHLATGIKLTQVLDELWNKRFNEVLDSLCLKTNRSYGDSFLYPKQEELYQKLGIPDTAN